MQRSAVGGRTVVLLTGFGPFPTVPRNATQWLVPHVAAHARRVFPDIHVEPVIVPTSWDDAPRLIADLVEAIDPDIALHFGVSGRAKGFELETRAFNTTAEIPDIHGNKSSPKPLIKKGADLRLARFPANEIVARLRARNIPAIVSRDAGRYLCNAVLYHALHTLRRKEHAVRCGFVHVPTRLARARALIGSAETLDHYGTWTGDLPDLPHPAPRSPLTWNEAIIGSLDIIAACLGRSLPLNAVLRKLERHL
jgi:pyroglutamyl-peptidase